jgi:hypothetical protein
MLGRLKISPVVYLGVLEQARLLYNYPQPKREGVRNERKEVSCQAYGDREEAASGHNEKGEPPGTTDCPGEYPVTPG